MQQKSLQGKAVRERGLFVGLVSLSQHRILLAAKGVFNIFDFSAKSLFLSFRT